MRRGMSPSPNRRSEPKRFSKWHPPPQLTGILRVTDDENQYWIDAFIEDKLVQAVPDTGSTLNLISEGYVTREGLGEHDRTRTTILLPNNHQVKSSGSLTVLLKFTKEDTARPVNFTILRGCVHDLILSGTLLREAQTFTKFREQIQRAPTALQAPIRVCLNGRPRQSVIGSIDGHRVIANPDTGSNVNVIEKSLANQLDFTSLRTWEMLSYSLWTGRLLGRLVSYGKWCGDMVRFLPNNLLRPIHGRKWA
jgi:hypothetical protein